MEITAELVLLLVAKGVPYLIGTIGKCAKEARAIAKRTKGNELKCQRLIERIEIFAETLDERKLQERTNRSIKLALAYLVVHLQECIAFMEEFYAAGRAKHLWNNKKYFSHFQLINVCHSILR